MNCAACGHACPAGWGCCDGRCADICDGACCAAGATCVDGSCVFGVCDASNCPGGYQCVNGGCFQITSGLSCDGCSAGCGGQCSGSVDGSNDYLCGRFYPCSPFTDPNCHNYCQSNGDCAAGTACVVESEISACIAPC